MVISGRGREQFLRLSRGLGLPDLPHPFVSVTLWFFVVWKFVVVSGLRSFVVSESGVSGWGGRELLWARSLGGTGGKRAPRCETTCPECIPRYGLV